MAMLILCPAGKWRRAGSVFRKRHGAYFPALIQLPFPWQNHLQVNMHTLRFLLRRQQGLTPTTQLQYIQNVLDQIGRRDGLNQILVSAGAQAFFDGRHLCACA